MITLSRGQIVRNLGILAKVAGFHEITGAPILRDLSNGFKWLADAAKCEPVAEAPSGLRHKDGLVIL